MKMKLTGVIMCLMILFFISCKTMEMGKSASPDLLEYSKIYDYEGKGQDELYVKANAWFVDNFNSAESVIQFQDKESGKLMGKYASKAKITIYQYAIKSTIEIDIKPSKIRLIFKDPYFKLTNDGTGNTYSFDYKPLVKEDGAKIVKADWMNLAESFDVYIKKDDSW